MGGWVGRGFALLERFLTFRVPGWMLLLGFWRLAATSVVVEEIGTEYGGINPSDGPAVVEAAERRGEAWGGGGRGVGDSFG